MIIGIGIGIAALLAEGANPELMVEFVGEILETDSVILLGLISTAVSLFLTSIAGAAFSKKNFVERLSLGPTKGVRKPLLFALLLTLVGYSASTLIFSAMIDMGFTSPALEMLSEILLEAGAMDLAVLALLVGIVVPIGEELLFRGYLQTRLKERWGSKSAILISALVFALFHLDVIQSTYTFFIGLLLAVVADKTKSIRLPILIHMINNTVSLILGMLLGDQDPSLIVYVTAGALLSAGVLLLMWFQDSILGANGKTSEEKPSKNTQLNPAAQPT